MAELETTIAETWIFQQLAGDSTLAALIGGATHPRIYSDQAPQGAAYPYVAIAMLSDRSVLTQNGIRVMENIVYIVKAVEKTASYADITSIANRLDALLHKQSGTVTGGLVLSCTRENIIRFPETKNGVEYRHLGPQVRI